MNFIIQNSDDGLKTLDLERQIIIELINKNTLMTYEECNIDEIKLKDKNSIPVGTIGFVEEYLKQFYNIEKENPIEIPEYLRTDEFLKRDYKIVAYDNLPSQGNGNLFIKDVSTLKYFGTEVNTDYHNIKDWNNNDNVGITALKLNTKALYQLSSIFDIKSEYRVYVLQGKIENISNYNGDVTLFPDMKLINKAVTLINYHEKYLKSYTLDIMVGDKGTAIIEIHNFTSVGLYNTLWGNSLLYGYIDGINYLINDNRKLEEWSQ